MRYEVRTNLPSFELGHCCYDNDEKRVLTLQEVCDILNGDTIIKNRYHVILDVCGPRKIDVIKLVRELTRKGLKEAKDTTEKCPAIVCRCDSIDKARQIVSRFGDIGAQTHLEDYE